MRFCKLAVAADLCSFLCHRPFIAEEEEEEAKPLSGNIKFGYLATSGSTTETKSMNTGAEATYTLESWEHHASLAAIYAEDDNVTTAEAYEALWRSDWRLTERRLDFRSAELAQGPLRRLRYPVLTDARLQPQIPDRSGARTQR